MRQMRLKRWQITYMLDGKADMIRVNAPDAQMAQRLAADGIERRNARGLAETPKGDTNQFVHLGPFPSHRLILLSLVRLTAKAERHGTQTL